ncbi:hypothetical protein F8538_14065 [Edwardsiella ictaluri]|uniref:hypothetical protein n=1 Tax=Edwardsiella ictaluri TaxID=67780 RepID=UPI0018DD7324|nr:hypothetical protein [Edwardsiella ictaluri]QPW27781.1 hypothetical protein F8538_14065 [Edwardsiella ictaluri]
MKKNNLRIFFTLVLNCSISIFICCIVGYLAGFFVLAFKLGYFYFDFNWWKMTFRSIEIGLLGGGVAGGGVFIKVKIEEWKISKSNKGR